MKSNLKEAKVFYTRKVKSMTDFTRIVKKSTYYTFELSKDFVDKEIVSVLNKIIIEDKYRSPETEIRRVRETFDREYNRELDKLVYVKYENRNIAIGIISTRNNLWLTSYRYKVKKIGKMYDTEGGKIYDILNNKIYDYLFVVDDDVHEFIKNNNDPADVNDFLKVVKEYSQKVYDIENEFVAMKFAFSRSTESLDPRWNLDEKELENFWNRVTSTKRRIDEFLYVYEKQFKDQRAYQNLKDCASRLESIYR